MLRYMSDKEIDALVRSYDDERLLANYREALETPGSDENSWEKLLGAEVARRGLRV